MPRIDAFYRTYNKVESKMMSSANVRSVSVEVAADATPAEMIAAALAAGASIGTSRTGIYEIQTDDGIWTRTDKAIRCFERINGEIVVSKKFAFKSWEQLEAEEEAA